MKGSRAGKEEMKVSLFRDDINIYNESAKESADTITGFTKG